MKGTKGITLVALVITIVILIILATVAIGNITGSGGLLDRAKEGTEAYKANEIKEKMEIAKANAWINTLGRITPDSYFEQLEQEGIIGDADTDVEAINEEEGIYQVTTEDGYIFEVTIDEDGNIEIEYAGKGEVVGPRITGINLVGKTASSVEIEVETIRAEGATYTYSYKKVSEDEYTVPEGQDNSNNRYNYTGLAANETYNFKVVVTDKAGRTAQGIINETTVQIPTGGINRGEITWSGGKASVTVTTDEEGYDLEYQVNDDGWREVPAGGIITNLNHGDVVDVRLTTGTSYGEEITINIEDTEDPVILEFKETAITESSIAVSVTADDNSKGILTYEYKIGEGEYTAGTNANTHTFSGLAAGQEYVMEVKVTDQAGRSTKQTLTKTTNAMPGKETINIAITEWINGQATITVSTTETGYTLQYQINDSGNWIEIENGGTVTGLAIGTIIDVKLTNGISDSAECTLTIQDTEPPVITSFTETGVTANSITVETTVTDNSGGALKYEYRKESEAFVEGGATYQFTGLTVGTEYTLEVKVTDEAGLFDTETKTVRTAIQVPAEWDTTKVTPVLSKDNKYVPVPKGFTESEATGENEVNKGFVIYQGTEPVNDENVDSAQESRNQFVWIPVDEESLNDMYEEKEATLSQSSHGEAETTTSVYSKLRWITSDGAPGSIGCREPDILTDTDYGDASTTRGRAITIGGNGIEQITSMFGITGDNASIMKQWAEMLVNEYEAVYESIKKYDGFYIGRYELTGNTTTPTVQRNKVVLVNQNWYALKKACNEIVNTNEVQSIMIYGNMWDETMQWLVDTGAKKESEVYVNSSTWGNYNDSSGNAAILGAGSPQNSGYSDYWCANNVYDLAGNYGDGTQEAYDPLTFELLEGEFTPFPVTASLPQVVTSAATPLRAFPTATILLAQLCTSSKIASASMARAIS